MDAFNDLKANTKTEPIFDKLTIERFLSLLQVIIPPDFKKTPVQLFVVQYF